MHKNQNFFVAIQQQMSKSSSRTFLELDGGASITFMEAESLTAKLANKLTELGLQPGDRVTVQVDKSPQAVMLYLACLRAGLIFHPLNMAYTLQELDHFLADARPSLLVCDAARKAQAGALIQKHAVEHVHTLEANGQGTLWTGLPDYSQDFPVVPRQREDAALLIYTSGTTGKPKGAVITHENIASNAEALTRVWDWQTQDVLLHVLPIFHVHGLCVGLHLPLLAGSKIIFQPKFSVDKTIKLLPHASVMMAVPTIYTRLLTDSRFNRNLCATLRLFISGSAPLLPETFTEFELRTGHRILERYGMTEAQMISSNPLQGTRRGGTVGFALPGVALRICDANGAALSHNEIGTLEIKGPNVFKGYWQNPEATQATFRDDGYFITGDIATVDENGVLSIVGREKDLIISAGLNIYPSEIELQINQIPGVIDSAVFGAPHKDLGEGVVAAVIRRSIELSATDISQALEEDLSAFKLPRHIVFVEQFPRNAMGKIEKNRLREQYQSVFSN